MVLDDFWEHLGQPFENCVKGKMPTTIDKSQVTAAINDIEKSESLNLDINLRQNYFRALVLSTLWIDHKVTDHELHCYTSSLLERGATMTSGDGKNSFFYYEATLLPEAENPSTYQSANVWLTKAELCLIAGGIFRDRFKKQRQILSHSDTSRAGKNAYEFAAGLFSQHHNTNSRQKSNIASKAHRRYQALEESLYTIGKTHIFAQRQSI